MGKSTWVLKKGFPLVFSHFLTQAVLYSMDSVEDALYYLAGRTLIFTVLLNVIDVRHKGFGSRSFPERNMASVPSHLLPKAVKSFSKPDF